jgi:predicted small metal-binding protein
MEVEVRCDCGWTIRGSENDVVDAMQVHMRLIHASEITREQVLARTRPT